jgi:hypothetical protein
MSKVFAEKNDFRIFYDETINTRRYIHTDKVNEFLQKFRVYARSNYLELERGNHYYRAQNGFNKKEINSRIIRVPYNKERMFPLREKAKEGRINPKGIPYLYLTEEYDNALYEIKAQYRNYITIGKFQIKRNLNVVYFHNRMNYLHSLLLSEKFEDIDLSVWNEINLAFSKPIANTDQTAEYVPTQVLAEIIKDEGFDGILYMSQYFDCYNLCIFNVDDAKLKGSKVEYIRSKYYQW